MFNRKITPESFDQSLNEYPDFSQDSQAQRDLFSPTKPLEHQQIDFETGEILKSRLEEKELHKNPNNLWQSYERQESEFQSTKNTPKTKGFSSPKFQNIFIFFGSSIGISILCCGMNYYIHSTKFSNIETKFIHLSSKVDNFSTQLKNNQLPHPTTEDIDQLFDEIDNLTNALESVEISFEEHLQNSKKTTSNSVTKSISPTTVLKNIVFLGLFGTIKDSQALIKVRQEVKSFQVGQEILDFWHLSAVTASSITLTHRNGMTHTLFRK